MKKFKEFSDLIEKIYAAAINPTEYSALAADIAIFMDSHSAVIQCREKVSGAAELLSITDNFSQKSLQDYSEHYYKVDEWMNRGANVALGRSFIGSELISFQDFERSECYTDYGRNLGLYDAIAMVFPTQNGICAVGAHRNKRALRFKNQDKHVFNLIAAHLSKSIDMSLHLEASAAVGKFVVDKLMALETPVLIVDRDLNLKFMSEGAENIFRSGSSLFSMHGKLCVRQPEITEKILRAVREAEMLVTGENQFEELEISECKPSLSLKFIPIPSTNSSLNTFSRLTAIFLTMKNENSTSTEEKLMRYFNLTRAESRLGAAICCGITLNQYAEAKKLSIETVRSHMKRIFYKTGTHRQLEFASLANSLIKRANE